MEQIFIEKFKKKIRRKKLSRNKFHQENVYKTKY